MADLKKRITSLTEKTTLTSGDFIAVDNASGGTKKYNYYADKTALDQAVEDIAEIETEIAVLDNPEGMTVGNAEQLLSDVYTEDKEPYKYRASFSGDREFDEIVGGTVAWNQLVQNGDFSNGTTGWSASQSTISADSNGLHVTNGTNAYPGADSPLISYVSGHKYLMIASGCYGDAGGEPFGFNNKVGINTIIGNLTTTKQDISRIFSATQTGNYRCAILSNRQTSQYHVKSLQVFDLTQMFGSTIADYIYAQEQATAGAGVAIFRKLFPASYYAYNAGELISVSGLSAHIMRDANNNIIGNYPLDSSLTLRGIPKLADGKMYFDGDVYASDGTVTRRYGVRAYHSGDTNDGTMITDGTNTVYALTTPTTETAEPYQNPQIVSEYGTEEYVSTTICPVGHNTKYPENLRKKIEGLPWDLSMIAPIENGTTASKAYSVGQYFLHNNVFCKAKTSIASGATFTLNTNYTETTVAAELYSALH